MPNYIMELRKWIGHQPVLMVGASVIVEDGQGRILLQGICMRGSGARRIDRSRRKA